jgi:hypothetical protein
LTHYSARAILRVKHLKINKLKNEKQKTTTMKTNHHNSFVRIFSAFILVAAILIQTFQASSVSAAQITDRKLTLQAGATDGGSKAGGVVNHKFDFSVAGGSVGSIKFQYCTTAAPVAGGIDCNLPTGINTTAATLGSESGATGFTGITTATNGTVIISRAAASAVGAIALSYTLNSITNPTTDNQTFFVRISTHTSLNATDVTPVDSGTVTAATAEQILLDGTMPESLVFCTGETIGLTGGVPDCATATDGIISFDQLFSPTDTATASSQMVASTNAGDGYAITVNGPTLTSGSNTISAIGAQGPGIRGVSQFGLNLKLNTTATSTVPIGAEVAVASNGTNYRGQATTDYGTVDNFKFVSGNSVANSGFNTLGGSDAQIFTVAYMVNVPGSQPAGTYTTTLTYICTPTF